MKSKWRILALISSLSLGMAGCGVQTSPANPAIPSYSAEAEALYLKRYNSRGKSQATALSAYDTLGPIYGTKAYQKLPTSQNPTISPSAIKKANDYVAEMNTSAFIVWRNGAVEHESYFGEFNADSLIVSKSLAKPISMLAVGRAIHEGHIKSLEQSVSDFITEWKGTEKEKILVRHLLDMRAGLLPQGQSIEPEHILNRAYMHPHHDEVIIHEYPLTHEPGTRYEYANSTAELVAPLIERATGTQYEDWIGNEILTPLGARDGQIWMNRLGGTPHSGCCTLLTADSYLRFAILLLRDGKWEGKRLLPVGFVDQVKKATPENPHTGMGVYVAGPYIEKRGPLNPEIKLGQTLHSEPYLAADLFMFDGNSHQTAYIVPSADMIILRTGNWVPKDKVWDNSQLPNILLRGIEFEAGKAPAVQQ